MSSYLLGISCFYHDSAAVLLQDGVVVAAVQEERFTRIKHDSAFPEHAIRFCLEHAGIGLGDVEKVLYYEDPRLKFSRIVGTFAAFAPRGGLEFCRTAGAWLTRKLHVRTNLQGLFKAAFGRMARHVEYVEHHESHAASAFYAGPFEHAAVLCVDGVGEWATTTGWVGHGNTLEKLWEIRFPHSLGLLYSAVTWFCGFKVDSGEYKLMGLAPYGIPRYAEQIRQHLIDIKDDGSFQLDMAYFDYAVGETMTTPKFDALFGGPRREPEGLLTAREFDLAASIQVVLEEVMLKMTASLQRTTGARNLCMAGGVALNCVANGKIAEHRIFDHLWVQPAAGDAGGALGAALTEWFTRRGNPRKVNGRDAMSGSLLGTEYNADDIRGRLEAVGATYRECSETILYDEVASYLADGNVVGWFQGRMEFGPRSLGSRSILGDARNVAMQTTMNLKIKNRESFRPFAPAVLEEHSREWFDHEAESPYMLFVHPVTSTRRRTLPDLGETGLDKLRQIRSDVPAVTHVDYSARLQTIGEDANPAFRELVRAFHRQTGCPVVVNTSFNVRGEPIVQSPEDAYRCFMRTEMDYLIVGNFIIEKKAQPDWEDACDWRTEFALD
ncbi:MAG: carbamoyltransferase [Luteibacter sp.]